MNDLFDYSLKQKMKDEAPLAAQIERNVLRLSMVQRLPHLIV